MSEYKFFSKNVHSIQSIKMNNLSAALNKIKYESPKMILEAQPSASDTPISTIIHAMKIHQVLCDITAMINSYFEMQLLVIILTAFIVIVFDSYYIMELLNESVASKYRIVSKLYLELMRLTNAVQNSNFYFSFSLICRTSHV